MKNKMLWVGSVIILILSVICFVVFGVGTDPAGDIPEKPFPGLLLAVYVLLNHPERFWSMGTQRGSC